jgi:hypothetical protein
MSTEQRLQANHPLMREWTAYKQTEEYANSRKWAQQEAHVDGSMWAAFMAGWMAHESYADASEAEKAQAKSERPPSPTAGMNIAQRILHVGGRNNAAGYVEFGSIQAVQALVSQVLRDLPAAPAAPVAAPLTDELTGKLMRIHAALGKMGKKYGEIGSRDVDVARWNADLYEAIAAVGGVLADQPLEQLARIKLEGGQE